MVSNDFFYRNVEVDLIERYSFFQILKSKNKNTKSFFYLFEIREKEFRKSDMLYYSRILTYRHMGILQKSGSLYVQFFPYDCSTCFTRMSSLSKCDACEKDYSENDFYFINMNNLFSLKEYFFLKKRFNLGFISEVYRDQRISMNNCMKEEIVQKALHPDRICKILELTNDHWSNIDNYI